MHSIRNFLFVLLNAFFISAIFYGCEETCPGVNFNPDPLSDTFSVAFDPSITSQTKNVLFEEFTGVNCPNCPAGQTLAASIVASHPEGRVILISNHSGDLSFPFPFSNYDFTTTEGEEIDALVGPAPFWPSADVNRKLLTGQTNRIFGTASWASAVQSQVEDSVSKVQMKMERNFNDADRNLEMGIILQYSEAINKNLNLSVMLIESGMIDPQKNGGVVDTYYVHRHVLRDMLTPAPGTPIVGNKTPGHATKYQMNSFSVPVDWNADSVKIVSFVTDADSLNVMQVIEKSLK